MWCVFPGGGIPGFKASAHIYYSIKPAGGQSTTLGLGFEERVAENLI